MNFAGPFAYATEYKCSETAGEKCWLRQKLASEGQTLGRVGVPAEHARDLSLPLGSDNAANGGQHTIGGLLDHPVGVRLGGDRRRVRHCDDLLVAGER